jgi:two-component system response regulator
MNKIVKKLLLIEDNADDEALTLRVLKKNYSIGEIVVARDGAEAVDYLFAQGVYDKRDPRDLPEVVLLDVKLPKLDGHEVLKQIRQNDGTKLIPVIMLTSSREEGDIRKSYLLGANGYVQKPVDFGQFTDAVKTIGSYWLGLNENASPA